MMPPLGGIMRLRYRFISFLFFILLFISNICRGALPENFIDLSDDVQAMLLEIEFFSEQGHSFWGDEFVAPSSQSYVKYLDNYACLLYTSPSPRDS